MPQKYLKERRYTTETGTNTLIGGKRREKEYDNILDALSTTNSSKDCQNCTKTSSGPYLLAL